ncbi:hypothetical protein [Dactylosporangium maewongense]|uniref:hypothetical protein n=1 Tax=Dactylosporangium maewongense TaxID=634393 RepID=UPI003CD08E43
MNFLQERVQSTAQLFASSAPDRFDAVRWNILPEAGGPHLNNDAYPVADCRVSRTVPVGRSTPWSSVP